MSFTASLADIVNRNENGLLSTSDSWARVPLADIASIQNGFAFSSSRFSKTKGVPLLRIRDVLRDRTEAFYEGEYDPAYLIEQGELVVGMDGDFNCALWQGPKVLLNQRVCRIIPNEAFYSRRLLAYVLPGYLAAINAETSSVTVKHLSSRTIAEIPLPLPPFSEQRRIVEEIERRFSQLDAGVAALERAKANLKNYRASVLQSACEGRLVPTEAELARTEGREYEPADQLLTRILKEHRATWEAEQLAKMEAQGKAPKDDKWKAKYKEPAGPDRSELSELPEGWVWARVEQLGNVQLGRQRSPKNRSKDFPTKYIRAANITENGLDLADVLEMEFRPHEFERYQLESGDILLSEASGSAAQVGKPAIWKNQIPNCCFQNTVIRFRPERLPSEYFLTVFKDFYVNGIFSKVSSGVGINHLSANKFAALPAPLPPLPEQYRIVAEVENRLSMFDKLEATITASLKRAERLRQAILKQAFEGKLVPQDPNDEPASVLLERIRQERARKAEEEKAKRKPARKKMAKTKRATSKRGKQVERQPLLEVLNSAAGHLTPEQLFNQSGYTPEDIEEFYEELNHEVLAQRIEQERPNATDVYLRAVGE